MHHAVATTVILCLFAAPALAQESCANAVAQSDLNQCAYDQWMVEDAALNDGYTAAMKIMKRIDADLPPDQRGGADALREAQRAWVTFRDNACEAAGYPMRGGSAEPLLVYGCLAELTAERANHLWSLAESFDEY